MSARLLSHYHQSISSTNQQEFLKKCQVCVDQLKNDIDMICKDIKNQNIPVIESDDEDFEIDPAICEYVENREKELAKLSRRKIALEEFLDLEEIKKALE